MTDQSSTLKRPPEPAVRRFHAGQVGGDTIRTFPRQGLFARHLLQGLRLVEWTPPELERRFGDRPDLRIADLAPRLSCAGAGGCGSREIAVFPHLYDQPWTSTVPES